MRKIQVENIDVEMVLGRDVSSSAGNVLLGKGTLLTPAMGRRLKNWGISFVYVEGEEESQQEEQSVRISPDAVRAQLERKFTGLLDDPIMQKIFAAVLEYQINGKHA